MTHIGRYHMETTDQTPPPSPLHTNKSKPVEACPPCPLRSKTLSDRAGGRAAVPADGPRRAAGRPSRGGVAALPPARTHTNNTRARAEMNARKHTHVNTAPLHTAASEHHHDNRHTRRRAHTPPAHNAAKVQTGVLSSPQPLSSQPRSQPLSSQPRSQPLRPLGSAA